MELVNVKITISMITPINVLDVTQSILIQKETTIVTVFVNQTTLKIQTVCVNFAEIYIQIVE